MGYCQRLPVESLVSHLEKLQISGTENPWAGADAVTRRDNLRRHLSQRNNQFLMVALESTKTCAGTTGIPLVSDYSVAANIVPSCPPEHQSARAARQVAPAFDPHSELWRAMSQLRVADQTLSWSILPAIPVVDPINNTRIPDEVYLLLGKFAKLLYLWHTANGGDMTVLAVGSKTQAILQHHGVPSQVILPPRKAKVSVIDQVVEIVAPKAPTGAVALKA